MEEKKKRKSQYEPKHQNPLSDGNKSIGVEVRRNKTISQI
jgi:hypothetical protein